MTHKVDPVHLTQCFIGLRLGQYDFSSAQMKDPVSPPQNYIRSIPKIPCRHDI